MTVFREKLRTKEQADGRTDGLTNGHGSRTIDGSKNNQMGGFDKKLILTFTSGIGQKGGIKIIKGGLMTRPRNNGFYSSNSIYIPKSLHAPECTSKDEWI